MSVNSFLPYLEKLALSYWRKLSRDVHVIKSVNYLLPEMNVYCTVKCEGEAVKSHMIKNKDNPEWNFKCIFYRKKPDEHINIEVQSISVKDFIFEFSEKNIAFCKQ